jgi:hypothetical protein
MVFQTAGIEIGVWVPPLVACVISFFTSMAGISGAFLLLPFQMSFLGYTNPSVSATNQLFNIVAIPSGVYRYWKEGRMVWPLTGIIVAGTLPGVFIGAIIRVAYLPNPKYFKMFAAAVLLYIGFKMMVDLIRKKPNHPTPDSSEHRIQEMVRRHHPKTADQSLPDDSLPAVKISYFNINRLGYTFDGESFDISFWGVFSLSLIVGVIGGIYGIGGGAIIAPFLITFFRLPVHTVAGAALMGTFITSVAGVFFYQIIAPFYPGTSVAPDWLLGILFGMGGAVGIYLGARCQKFVPASAIKWMLTVIVIFVSTRYITEFFWY